MPFRSEKQRRYLWKNHPKIARDWTDTYGSKPVKKKHGGKIKIWGEDPKTVWPIMNKDQKEDFKKRFPGHTPDDAIPKKAKGGSMDPYYGSYIKGRVDGKTLSNPSYRKYYKGLI